MEATTTSGQSVDTLCDSKEFQEKLKEVWDRREELRCAVKQNNAVQNFTRSYGSSRRKNLMPRSGGWWSLQTVGQRDAQKSLQLSRRQWFH
uniref:Uncharacterized protein n=1 Tax=Taenia solium TaxID=6204 RepID=Q8MPC4_TAESO|nr:hypothetical protein [Taenia solium]